jgi:hypothetical protein
MTRCLLAVAVVLGLWVCAPAAQAHDRYYFSFRYGYPYPYWRHWDYPYYRPYWGYYGPPPYYYAPPPPAYSPPVREPYCVQDKVYRYLPDGQIQWGTRTRCY